MADRTFHNMLGGLTPTRSNVKHEGEIVVIGLGRFGSSLASTLIDMGHEVLGIDADATRVQQHIGLLTHVVEADTTNENTLRQLGVGEAVTVVVAIGADIEASADPNRPNPMTTISPRCSTCGRSPPSMV